MRREVFFVGWMALCLVAACQSDANVDSGADAEDIGDSDTNAPASSDSQAPTSSDSQAPGDTTTPQNGDSETGSGDNDNDTNSGDSGDSETDSGPLVRPECITAADCQLAASCCGCGAFSVDVEVAPCPPIACLVDECFQYDLPPEAPVVCSKGKCALNIDCDVSHALCNMMPPRCEEEGWVPTVQGMCYGPCVPSNQCPAVN
ncbi:MAG: MSCRAMM family adhesin SdrC [Proteobacteria bacterium]|nr:MSCRAMM family adhesin SdrC [Pseudomonadota bacterium]